MKTEMSDACASRQTADRQPTSPSISRGVGKLTERIGADIGRSRTWAVSSGIIDMRQLGRYTSSPGLAEEGDMSLIQAGGHRKGVEVTFGVFPVKDTQ